jgi:hypothetical protein
LNGSFTDVFSSVGFSSTCQSVRRSYWRIGWISSLSPKETGILRSTARTTRRMASSLDTNNVRQAMATVRASLALVFFCSIGVEALGFLVGGRLSEVVLAVMGGLLWESCWALKNRARVARVLAF